MSNQEYPSTSGPAAPARPPTGSRGTAPFWPGLVAVLCLAATAAMWWQTRSELSAMRSQQRELVDVLDAIRGVSTIDVAGDQALGPESAQVTLIEFSDYECPFCIRHFMGTMPAIQEKYIRSGRIRYVFKDFPIDQLHPEAIQGHLAARCAGDQGKFWEMHGRMWGPAGSHTSAALEQHATDIGLSLETFQECMAGEQHSSRIRDSVDLAIRLGANGTPSFFVGLRDPETNRVRVVESVVGAQPIEAFEEAIASAEAQARQAR